MFCEWQSGLKWVEVNLYKLKLSMRSRHEIFGHEGNVNKLKLSMRSRNEIFGHENVIMHRLFFRY